MTLSGRDTPPSIQDGPYGYEPDAVSNFEALANDGRDILDGREAIKIGQEIWGSSTNWLNSGRRSAWNNSLRAFNSQHSMGSKYLSNDYRFRSTLYRPKTRAMVRRDEAQTAASFFSNEDVVSITVADDDDPQQQASAEILKALLQYRLTKTIPWFLTLVGARQDAEVMGICVAKTGWEYQERFVRSERRPKMGDDGMEQWDDQRRETMTERVNLFEVIKDEPFVDLLAPENFRFDPGCDWRNPVKSSPFLIELCPTYVNEALEKMEAHHGQPAEWNRVAESALHGSNDLEDDVTRRSREPNRIPGKDHDAGKGRGFDICWTRVYTLRWRGQDWYYRTLSGSGELLEDPKPLREVVLHGERPYAVGSVIVETHKTYPSGKVELTTDLQRAANQDWNSRFDSIMLSLQPRQFAREGAGVDQQDLRTFAPGKVVMVNAGKGEPLTNTITWDRPPEPSAASFQEQDRINLDWDDLTGSFSNSSVRSSEVSEQSATGMHLMSGEASSMGEYELRVFAETFVEPVLRQLIKLEQAYETDPVILALAGKQSQLLQKFNIDEITDELLNHEVTTKVNVGIGASNPQLKLKNFATGAQIIGSIFGQSAAMGANFQEVSKEVFGMLGYKDGERFFQPNFDPRVAMMQQQMQKQQGKGDGGGQDKVQVANINAQSKMSLEQLKAQTSAHQAQLDFQTQKMEEDAETQREIMRMAHDAGMQGHQHEHERGQGMQKMQFDASMGAANQQHAVGLQGMKQTHDSGEKYEDRQFQSGQQERAQSHESDMNNIFQGLPGQARSQPSFQSGQGQARSNPPMQTGNAGSADGQTHARSAPSASFGQATSPAPSAPPQGNSGFDPTQFATALAQIMQNAVQAIDQAANRFEQTSDRMEQAMSRKRRIIRGADGRVEGIE